jgi:hypothetical protein
MDLLPDDGAGWWWQVLSHSSDVPVLGQGRADDMLGARVVVEALMRACEGAMLGLVLGPTGTEDLCRRTINRSLRWMPRGGY